MLGRSGSVKIFANFRINLFLPGLLITEALTPIIFISDVSNPASPKQETTSRRTEYESKTTLLTLGFFPSWDFELRWGLRILLPETLLEVIEQIRSLCVRHSSQLILGKLH